jgi:hypothetical protein
MNINEIIKSVLLEYLNEQQSLKENIQLADKIYFKTDKLTDEDRDIILSITGGNNYTKIISDFYYALKYEQYYTSNISKTTQLLYNEIKNYNKNVFPIIGYDVYYPSEVYNLISSLETREKIIKEISKLPSIAIRNLRNDIRKERHVNELKDYLHNIEYFMFHYAFLANRSDEVKIKILNKMFKNNTTLDDLMRFTDEKANFIGGVDFTKDDIKKLSEQEDFEIIYEQGEVMIVRVDSPEGIKAIGCNSLWCFTYGSGFDQAYRMWSNYSYNDIVYVIIDFKEKSDSDSFMHVLIKPLINDNGKLIKYSNEDVDDYPIFNMSNENYYSPYSILKNLFGSKYVQIIKKYLNFDYE